MVLQLLGMRIHDKLATKRTYTDWLERGKEALTGEQGGRYVIAVRLRGFELLCGDRICV